MDDFAAWSTATAARPGETARIAALLEAMADLWFVIDADGVHRQSNHAEHALLPRPYAELRGHPLTHGLAPDLAALWCAGLREAVAGGTVQRLEATLDGSDGASHIVEASIAPLGAGEALFLLRDVTRERAAQAALRERQVAEIANRVKSEFLSRVSHEMRTPLNAVIGFTQLLRLAPEGTGAAQVDEFTEHVLHASQRLLALVNDLLDLQRIDEQRLVLDAKPLTLHALAETVFALLRPLADQHGVVLRNEIAADAIVLADAQRSRQLLINVVTNAIRYNRPGGWVRVATLAPVDGCLAFAVEDTGPGISQAEADRLFQPFERLGRESSSLEGSGLGLTIAQRLARAMGGALTLGPRAGGQGTQVRIALPVPGAVGTVAAPMVDAGPAAPPAVTPEPQPCLPALRLLYVEDNRINAILFGEAMRMQGRIELRVAEDGAEAMSIAAEWAPEVLVLDANLPDMSGYAVLERLRTLPALARVPAYMCSADALDADLQRARDAGFAGYWTKPIDIGRVLADLEPWLNGRARSGPTAG